MSFDFDSSGCSGRIGVPRVHGSVNSPAEPEIVPPRDENALSLPLPDYLRRAAREPRTVLSSTHTPALLRAAFIVLIVFSRPLLAQPRLDLPSSCPACSVVLEDVVVFQSVWDDGALSALPASVSRFARSRWAVVDPTTRQLELFDSRGRHVSSSIRSGDGPGELRRPMLSFDWQADSTVVLDRSQARMSVFDPSGTFRRSAPFSGGAFIRVMFTPTGGIVAATRVNTREKFGIPFHEFDSQGVLRRSFGARVDQKVVQAEDLPVYRTVRRTRPDGSFWTVEAYFPRLQRWSATGDVLEDWTLPMPDFVRFKGLDLAAPGAEFESIEETPDGKLVVVMGYRSSRYREAFGPARVMDGRLNPTVQNWGRYMAVRVFVLDPSSRTLITTVDSESFVYVSLGDSLYWGIKPQGEQGTVAVFRLRVRR